MSGPSPIQPDQPSFAVQPPKSREALFHQGMSAASAVNELLYVVENQLDGIKLADYNIKISHWLQQNLALFSNAVSEIRAGTYPKGINDLLHALKALHQLNGMSAKELGGAFGAANGKTIKSYISNMYSAIKDTLGPIFKGVEEPKWANLGKALENYLSNPSKYPISNDDKEAMQYALNNMIADGKTPLGNLIGAVDNQLASLSGFSTLNISAFNKCQKNGISGLQTAGNVTNQFWKVIIQMIGTLQSGQ